MTQHALLNDPRSFSPSLDPFHPTGVEGDVPFLHETLPVLIHRSQQVGRGTLSATFTRLSPQTEFQRILSEKKG